MSQLVQLFLNFDVFLYSTSGKVYGPFFMRVIVVNLKLSVMIFNYFKCVFSAHMQWVLSPKYFNFPFPITLTMIHMGFSGAVAFFLIRVLKVSL